MTAQRAAMNEAMELEKELDQLYGAPVREFVRARAALVIALRREQREAEASQVARLQKPGLAAWVVNQLYRTQAEAVAELLSAGAKLRAAQRQLLSGGDAEALRQAFETERTALLPLVHASRKILSEAGHAASSSTLERVKGTLRALARLEQASHEFVGRLTTELAAPGLEALASAEPTDTTSSGAKQSGLPIERARREQEASRLSARNLRQSEDKVRDMLRAAERAEALVSQKKTDAERARHAARDASRVAEKLEKDAAQAEADALLAREALDGAKRELLMAKGALKRTSTSAH